MTTALHAKTTTELLASGRRRVVLGALAIIALVGTLNAQHITTLSPNFGPVNTPVTITGSGFGATQGSSTVKFMGVAVQVTSWSDTSIAAIIPSSFALGSVNCKVWVNGVGSNEVPFTVTPGITSASPSSGAVGTSIVVSGTNFGSTQGASTITFNGAAATPTNWSATSITVPVPSSGTTGNIVVTVSSLQSNGFGFVVPPSITGLNPNIGSVGTPVTISGFTFGSAQGSSSVTFNGTATTPSAWSSASITAPVPNGASSGNVVVTVNGVASNGVNFTVNQTAGNLYCSTSGTWTGPTTDGAASLPIACYYTALNGTPSPGTVRGPVSTVAALNSAYSAASCGDVIQIAAGASLTGPVTFTGKGCDDQHYITIESTGITDPNFPPEGTRATPCIAAVPSLPNRPTYPCSVSSTLVPTFIATSSNHALVLRGADHLRFIGIEFTRVTTAGALIYSVIDINENGSTQSSKIVFDRVWIHGVNADSTFPQTSTTDTSTTRGIYLGQSNHIAVVDSYMSDFYDNGSTASNGNTDAQCVSGGSSNDNQPVVANSGWGVYKFVNNHCEGASEGILIGGSGGPPLTPSGCTFGVTCNDDVPADLEVRSNYFFAPNSWNGNTTTDNVTGWPNRKNGLEFKSGARILLEGNVFENCWYNSQPYCYVFDFAPKNQPNGAGTLPTCPSCLVEDFTARYNYGYNYPGPMIAVYSTHNAACPTCTTLGRRGSVHDNLVGDKLNRGQLTGLTGFDGIQFLADAGPMTNISLRHNSVVNAYRSFLMFGAVTAGTGSSGFDQITIQDNIGAFTSSSGGAPYLPGNGSSGACDTSGITLLNFLNNCINGGTPTWTLDHNFVMGASSLNGWPTGNTPVASGTAMNFVNYNSGDSNFTPGNYALLSTSPGHNAASDGTDVGADIPTLLNKIAGVKQ